MKQPPARGRTGARGAALRAVVLGTVACTSPPPIERPPLEFEIPAQWVAGETVPDAPPQTRPWWERFGDAETARIVTQALAHNHDLRAAAARVEQAVAQATIAGADRWPQLSGTLGVSRERVNFVGFPFGGALTTTRWRTALDLGWELDLWGRLEARERAALEEVGAAEADLAGAWLSLSAQAAKAWFSLIESAQQLELARQTAASFRDSARRVRDRAEIGVGSRLDERLADANVAAADALIAQWVEARERAVRRLEILLGAYPAGALAGAARLPDVGPPVPAGLPADLLRRRPDVAAAERRVRAAGARGDAARGDLYPRLSLTASGGTTSVELEDLLDGDARVWSIAGGILQPIFEGGRLRARVELADAETREALEVWAAILLGAFAEVEAALAVEAVLQEREQHLETAAAQSRAARELAEARYGQGIESYLTVLEAQRREFDSESQRLAARLLRLETRVDLHIALGGGFEAARVPDQPIEANDADAPDTIRD